MYKAEIAQEGSKVNYFYSTATADGWSVADNLYPTDVLALNICTYVESHITWKPDLIQNI